MKILVTGATGLIGAALCPVLEQQGHHVVRAVRRPTGQNDIEVGDIGERASWHDVLKPGFDVVVHLAGAVPEEHPDSPEQKNRFHRTNTLGTRNLARDCASSGVSRFVYLSSVKVLGEGKKEPYQTNDIPEPSDAYAISKLQAEQFLLEISKGSSMDTVIIRPPLVYGPGVRGNFSRLIRAIDQRRPLPLGAIQNQRSLIYLGNLIDVIRRCIDHPGAAGKIFLVSDNDDVSTPELIRRMAAALHRTPFLLPVPPSWMRFTSVFLAKRAAIDRLLGSLYVDPSLVQQAINWAPPYTMQEGLAATADWYLQSS